MSALAPSPVAARSTGVDVSAGISWTNPDADLWVGTAGGDYAGFIEFLDGHFVVHDATGMTIAAESSVPSAKSALVRSMHA